MSELGVLSHRYNTLSELSTEINGAVTILKKIYYKLPGMKDLSETQIEDSKDKLFEIMVKIIKNLSPGYDLYDKDIKDIRPLPTSFIERIKDSKKGEIPYYVEDLNEVIKHIKNNVTFTEKDIVILDELSSIMDVETSTVFRKFWRN